MKLIFCPDCWDVFKLNSKEPRTCSCGKCWGRLVDSQGLHGEYKGGIPLAIFNTSLVKAILDRPKEEGPGSLFEGCVIPEVCPTLKNLDDESGTKGTGT